METDAIRTLEFEAVRLKKSHMMITLRRTRFLECDREHRDHLCSMSPQTRKPFKGPNFQYGWLLVYR